MAELQRDLGGSPCRERLAGAAEGALLAAAFVGSASASAVAQQTDEATNLEQITVEGSGSGQGVRDTADGPLRDYVTTRTRAGSKTDMPLIETPQSVSVIGRKQIEATGSRTLGEATRYTPAVRELFTGADPRYDQYHIGGFDASTTGFHLDFRKILRE